jgi:oligopeptide/dipeptide ABC transporter ATP-binding protein
VDKDFAWRQPPRARVNQGGNLLRISSFSSFDIGHCDTRKGIVLPGDPPSPMNPQVGCRFHPRCPHMIEACKAEVPPLVDWGENHFAACIRVPEINW